MCQYETEFTFPLPFLYQNSLLTADLRSSTLIAGCAGRAPRPGDNGTAESERATFSPSATPGTCRRTCGLKVREVNTEFSCQRAVGLSPSPKGTDAMPIRPQIG